MPEGLEKGLESPRMSADLLQFVSESVFVEYVILEEAVA